MISVWDSYTCTPVRLAHFLLGSTDPLIKECAEFDQTVPFSITKEAKKYSDSTKFQTPPNLNDRPIT